MVDGKRLDGTRSGDRYVFKLPRVPATTHLVSRAASPAELGVARDPRVLGVALRQIELWQGRHLAVIDAADERLTDGIHAYEADCEHRWTDGYARLAESLFDGMDGPVELVLTLTDTATYPLVNPAFEGEPERVALRA
jgi:hypothetical protein